MATFFIIPELYNSVFLFLFLDQSLEKVSLKSLKNGVVGCTCIGLECLISHKHFSNGAGIDFIRFRLSKALTFSVKICM